MKINMILKMTLKEKAKKLKTDIPAVFLALKDNETPIFAKILAGITVAYALFDRRRKENDCGISSLKYKIQGI